MAPQPQPTGDPALAACKGKLYRFRIKELKDVLQELGLSKQGRKQELRDRVIALLSDQQDQVSKMTGKETVVKIVEDTFIQMQYPASTAAASKSQNEPGQNVPANKVQCPCGSSMTSNSMIKCDVLQCGVLQHTRCVTISEKPADSLLPESPPCFYCEMCRISRADPFWVTVNHPLLPLSIPPCDVLEDGSCNIQNVEKIFLLSRANWEMLQKDEYDLQVWCILLSDNVPFRMNWPLDSRIEVNGILLRVSNRQPTQKLGASGRDDGPVLTPYVREGPNKIVLSRSDSRRFCMGVRIAKRRSLKEVLHLVPKEEDGEKFDDAVARVRRCVGGGTEAGHADSDSDIEVVADSVSVNLRCPMTGSRIKIAGRFKPCVHMGCFDLEAFVELSQRARKWQCPICLKNYSLDDIIIDPYFNRITSLIQSYEDDASAVDVKPDGSWRIQASGPVLKDLSQWHFPDGTLCTVRDVGSKLNMGVVKHDVKEEPLTEAFDSGLKQGMRRNKDGHLEFCDIGHFSLTPSPDDDNDGEQKGNIKTEDCITLVCKTDHNNTEDGRNLEQGQFDHTTSNVHDLNSLPVDIIVLSDSDDDDAMVLSPSVANCGSAHDPRSTFLPNPPGTSGAPPDEPSILALDEGFGDLGLSFWEYPSSRQDDADYNPGEPQKYPANYQSLHGPASVNNLGVVAAATDLLEYSHDIGLQGCTSSAGDASMGEAYMDGRSETCNDGSADKLTSLSLCGSDAKNSASQKRMNPGDEIAASGPFLQSGNNGGLTGERRCRGSLLPSEPQRSVRPRMIISIDSDSD